MLDGASPQPRLFAEAPRTRSALLAARRAESTNELQARYDQWEACNPAWAQRLTGPAAAAALGYGKAAGSPGWNSRSEMVHARKTAMRHDAMLSSGFDAATQRQLTSHELDSLTTSIVRACLWLDIPLSCLSAKRPPAALSRCLWVAPALPLLRPTHTLTGL